VLIANVEQVILSVKFPCFGFITIIGIILACTREVVKGKIIVFKIQNLIYEIRGQKVMLDHDLAGLY